MLFEIFVILWLALLVPVVYLFVRSIGEAIEKGRIEKAAKAAHDSHPMLVAPVQRIPAGHARRRPVH